MRTNIFALCICNIGMFAATNVYGQPARVMPEPSALEEKAAPNPPTNAAPERPSISTEAPISQKLLPTPTPLRDLKGPSMWGSVPVGRQREISKWYGWQTILPLLLVDLNTVAVFATENKVFVYTGYLPWLPLHIASGSVVHLAHGRVGTSFLSLGLTTASTTLGWVAGLAFRGELITGAIGLLGMNIVDIAVLSREKKRVSVDKPRGAQLVLPSSIHLLPMLESNARGMSIVGMF